MTGLPEGWATANIAEVTSYVQRGKSPKYAEISALPVINQKCIRWWGFDPAHLKYVDQSQWAKWGEERFVRAGDILWNSTGTGTIGRAALYNPINGFDRLVVDSHVTIVRPVRQFEPKYLFYFVASPGVQDRISEMQSGSTNQVELSKGEVLATELPVAPLHEQRRIVAKLDSLRARSSRARQELDRIPALIERYKQAILAKAFSGELTAGWPSAKLGELLSEGLIGLVRSAASQREDVGVPYIRMNHFDMSGKWNFDKLTRVEVSEKELCRYKLKRGDVLFNTRNSYELVGKVALWRGSREPFVFNNNIMRMRFVDQVDSEFAALFLMSPVFREYLSSVKSATTSVCAIYQRSIIDAPFPVPSISDQRKAVTLVSRALAWLDKIATEHARAAHLLPKLDQAILAKAFRGELAPQDPSDEPASVLLERIRKEREAQPTKPRSGRKARA